MSTTKNSTTPNFEGLNDRLLETGRRVGTLSLDSYEKAVDTVVAWERKVAEQTPNAAVAGLITAHADLSRDLAKTYASAARELVAR
jgi:hypothetical protein